jgi:hypothetical protein
MKNIILILLNCSLNYSQDKKIDCTKEELEFNFYQITVLKQGFPPFFTNVLSNNISYNNISNNNLSLIEFLNNLYKNSYFTPLTSDRLFYISECFDNSMYLSKEKNEAFDVKFDYYFEKYSKKKSFVLKTKEVITIEGVMFKGLFTKIKKNSKNLVISTIYIPEINNVDFLQDIYIPIEIEKICSIKKL